jgi:hypothetical protein
MSKWTDIGDNHEIQFVSYKDDSQAGLNIRHKNEEGNPCVGFITFTGSSWAKDFNGKIQEWQVQSFEPLTCSPSILCKVCGDHGFIRNGRWEKA